MKTIVYIELSDDQRGQLADLLDGKTTSRLATRAEIVATCQRAIELIIDPAPVMAAIQQISAGGDFPAFDDYLMQTCGAIFGARRED